LYEETKWEKLKDRRNNHKLVLFHKMNYNKTPQYLAELIPKTVGTRHTHTTRQINNVVNINCRTSLYSEYFMPSTVKAWNDLPLPTRNLDYCNSFYEREQACDYFFYLLVSPILFLHTSCHVMLIWSPPVTIH
jgi:hypothetical protein